MLLTTHSNPDNTNHFWLNFVCISISCILLLTFFFLPSITHVQSSTTIIVSALFLFWGIAVVSMNFIPPPLHKQHNRYIEEVQEKPLPLQEEDIWKNMLKEHSSQQIPQVVAAIELPFQHVGVHTGEYRQEIEEAINTLYRFDADQQAISFCLHRLLQAAKQNWTDLAVFSPREREILELLLQNISYKEMGHRLHVSTSTIKTHVYHVFQKLEVSNRKEAVSFIRERGWFSDQT